MVYYEVRAKAKGQVLIESEEYNKIRKKLIFLICEMNKVANIEGKGRDDLTLGILVAAERVIRKVSVNCSKSIRSLAENVKSSFVSFRKMLNKYSENIESVDPQLKNNSDLVDNLYNLEVCWEKGKEFLLNTDNYDRLIFFSQLIEILCEKYKDLIELIETRDPSIFVSIPGLLILKCLENEDQGICKEYNPNMFLENKDCHNMYKELIKDFDQLRDRLEIINNTITTNSNDNLRSTSRTNSSKINNFPYLNTNNTNSSSTSLPKIRLDSFFLYNFLEKIILFEENLNDVLKNNSYYEEFYDKAIMNKFLGKIKTLSMNLQREKPTEWNSFFDMSMNTISS